MVEYKCIKSQEIWEYCNWLTQVLEKTKYDTILGDSSAHKVYILDAKLK